MRTTLTLDDDVSVQLKRLQDKKKKPFKDLVNEALRLGLRALTQPDHSVSKPYSTKSVDLGRCFLGSLDDVAEVLAIAEGETYK